MLSARRSQLNQLVIDWLTHYQLYVIKSMWKLQIILCSIKNRLHESLHGSNHTPDMSLVVDSPCWDPKFWWTGSHGSSCSAHCGWTSHQRWKRWFQKRKSDYLGRLSLQTLKGKRCMSIHFLSVFDFHIPYIRVMLCYCGQNSSCWVSINDTYDISSDNSLSWLQTHKWTWFYVHNMQYLL